ncbi:MAG: bifunctional diaminohydroxyphosphoribosylaminopyrimidine deaminase/5-amino-6-(5-phosphoribosylamino)uracil reductase RibD, partial [Candidatus Omnitrophota bacterium]
MIEGCKAPKVIGAFFMDKDKIMKRALALAARAAGRVSPNPMVGAVIFKGSKIISEGYHHYFGGDHAEIDALKKAGKKAGGASMAVNLEPCSHSGKTPPCVESIAGYGIKEVFAGMRDPNPLVAGKGFAYLRRHGIKVKSGIAKDDCAFLNRAFVSVHSRKRPWIVLKEGLSLDGRIASYTGNSKWITNPKARLFAHRLRYESDMVMAGAGTFRKDSPSLLPYLIRAKRHPLGFPARCVVTKSGLFKTCGKLVDSESPFFIAHMAVKSPAKAESSKSGYERIYSKNLNNLVELFAEKGYNQILIEGGGGLAGSLFDAGLIDEIYFIYAPIVIGGKNAVAAVAGKGQGLVKNAIEFSENRIFALDDNFVFHGIRPG